MARDEATTQKPPPIIAVRNIVKQFGSVIALSGVSMSVGAGEVLCLLGDNGAGKSTLIKTLSGVHKPSSGDFLVEGRPVAFDSPRDALDAGIATVYQDLAMIPLMSITRNFFMGRETAQGFRTVQILRFRLRPSGDARGDEEDRHRHPRPRTRRWARCRAASANAWPSPGRCISGPRC